ncbi:MAG TPA: MIP family channel protein [Solirubrobacteraceae bacterium]|jgi:aquaporin Z|nr:MIP family channel protein [Solirubrobacteraceae bacterium]
MPTETLRPAVAEFIGTFTLIFIGAGSIIAAHGIADPSLIGIALAHGLAIGVMVAAYARVSGAHFNPAVTFGFLLTRRIKPALAVVYWVAQLAGAAVAALLLRELLPSSETEAVSLGVPALGHGVNAAAGVTLEGILTFLLVTVVFATAVDPKGAFKSIAALAIGLTITLDILFGGPFTGAAMNPARAFGPQLVGNHWSNGWVWYVGPLVGGAIAALLYEFLYLPSRPKEEPPPVAEGIAE